MSSSSKSLLKADEQDLSTGVYFLHAIPTSLTIRLTVAMRIRGRPSSPHFVGPSPREINIRITTAPPQLERKHEYYPRTAKRLQKRKYQLKIQVKHSKYKMPGLLTEPDFKHITVKELHSTFVAEIQGVDFSKPVEPDVFSEIKEALAKVHFYSLIYHLPPVSYLSLPSLLPTLSSPFRTTTYV